MSEILVPNAFISQIAKKYDLSSTTLYNWRTDHNKRLSKNVSSRVSGGDFIELLSEEHSKSLQPKLSEISLLLGNVSLSIKGNLTTSSLVKILEVLEGQC